jgi:hypothetical protein
LIAALFKLKLWNVAFWLIVPTYMSKQAYQNEVDKRIGNMWRTHRNRTDKGLGSTFRESGYHEGLMQNHNFLIPNVSFTSGMLLDGDILEFRNDNPFVRWHKSFGDYPSHLADMDDYPMHETDDFERLKKYKPLKKDVVGVTPIIPR